VFFLTGNEDPPPLPRHQHRSPRIFNHSVVLGTSTKCLTSKGPGMKGPASKGPGYERSGVLKGPATKGPEEMIRMHKAWVLFFENICSKIYSF
jgi:hypothetical protein